LQEEQAKNSDNEIGPLQPWIFMLFEVDENPASYKGNPGQYGGTIAGVIPLVSPGSQG